MSANGEQKNAEVGQKLEGELQQILRDVRALVAERNALARRHARGGHAMDEHGVCDPYCDTCSGIRSSAKAEGLREAAKRCHANAHMDGNLSVTAFELEAMAVEAERG